MNSYQKEDLLSMEEKVLSMMNYKLTFKTRFSHAAMLMEKEKNIAIGSQKKKFKSLISFLL